MADGISEAEAESGGEAEPVPSSLFQFWGAELANCPRHESLAICVLRLCIAVLVFSPFLERCKNVHECSRLTSCFHA